MTELCENRWAALGALAENADEFISPDDAGLVSPQWQRLLLGRITQMLIDENTGLTGTELRHLLGLAQENAKPTAKITTTRLPAHFVDLVRQIYGVNLQTDVHPSELVANRENQSSEQVDRNDGEAP